jgi:hypothetical protein
LAFFWGKFPRGISTTTLELLTWFDEQAIKSIIANKAQQAVLL